MISDSIRFSPGAPGCVFYTSLPRDCVEKTVIFTKFESIEARRVRDESNLCDSKLTSVWNLRFQGKRDVESYQVRNRSDIQKGKHVRSQLRETLQVRSSRSRSRLKNSIRDALIQECLQSCDKEKSTVCV